MLAKDAPLMMVERALQVEATPPTTPRATTTHNITTSHLGSTLTAQGEVVQLQECNKCIQEENVNSFIIAEYRLKNL